MHSRPCCTLGFILAFGILQTTALSAQQVPVHNVWPLLETDKPIFGQFVNYIGVGSDRESAVAQAASPEFDFVVTSVDWLPSVL